MDFRISDKIITHKLFCFGKQSRATNGKLLLMNFYDLNYAPQFKSWDFLLFGLYTLFIHKFMMVHQAKETLTKS